MPKSQVGLLQLTVRCHNTQLDDIQDNDTQINVTKLNDNKLYGFICGTQHE
jgi:hypothetical protein